VGVLAVSSEEFLLEMCSGRAAWTVTPVRVNQIDLEIVSQRIESHGWNCTLRNRLCYTFSGDTANITLYPSGKLLIKTQEKEVAAKIAESHINNWLNVE